MQDIIALHRNIMSMTMGSCDIFLVSNYQKAEGALEARRGGGGCQGVRGGRVMGVVRYEAR
jgi:hypothetical protein